MGIRSGIYETLAEHITFDSIFNHVLEDETHHWCHICIRSMHIFCNHRWWKRTKVRRKTTHAWLWKIEDCIFISNKPLLCERIECYSLSFVRMHILTTTQEEVFSVHFYEGLIETVIVECQKWYMVSRWRKSAGPYFLQQRRTQVGWYSSPFSELLLRFLRTCRQQLYYSFVLKATIRTQECQRIVNRIEKVTCDILYLFIL